MSIVLGSPFPSAGSSLSSGRRGPPCRRPRRSGCRRDRSTPGGLAQGHVDMVELLAGEGCDVSPVDRFGRTPLHEAAINRHGGCVEALKRLGARRRRCFATRLQRLTPACWPPLLAAGALPSACDYDGRTALHIAACAGSPVLAGTLLRSLRRPIGARSRIGGGTRPRTRRGGEGLKPCWRC